MIHIVHVLCARVYVKQTSNCGGLTKCVRLDSSICSDIDIHLTFRVKLFSIGVKFGFRQIVRGRFGYISV